DYEQAQRHQLECIKITRKRHGTSYMPQRLGKLAEIAQKRGHIAEASSLYDEFTEITETILANSTSRYFAESIVDWMGDIYINHFVLALEHLQEPAQAFKILEQVRGRMIAVGLRSTLIDQIKQVSHPALYERK